MNPTSPAPSSFVARSPLDLVALAPVVIGFHPEDSVVLMSFGGPAATFHARADLALSAEGQDEVAAELAHAVRANHADRVAVVLYTDDEQVALSMADRLLRRLLRLGCEVIEVLRVDDECWFRVPGDGYGGTPYDLRTHPFTAQHVFAGRVVHRDRAELADSLVGTDEDDAVAVAQSATRFADLVLASQAEPDLLCSEAHWVKRRVRRFLQEQSSPDVGDAARLLVLASLIETRDVAWAQITRPHALFHVDLWRGLVRRAPRDLIPGAASLLAFASWQAGDGALAWCALDRALEVDPDYSMAHLISDLLGGAVPPQTWEPMSDADLPVLSRSRVGMRRTRPEP